MIVMGQESLRFRLSIKGNLQALLIEFYETKKINEITNFVYDKCIDGIAFDN